MTVQQSPQEPPGTTPEPSTVRLLIGYCEMYTTEYVLYFISLAQGNYRPNVSFCWETASPCGIVVDALVQRLGAGRR